MRQPIRIMSLVMLAVILALGAGNALAGPREDFERLVREVQAAPQDSALRERVIAAALALKPPPTVPAEARRHLARAQGAIELAKTSADMQPAIRELDQALILAPWWAEGYYNRGVVEDKAGRYADSARDLRLYLRAAPSARDAHEVEMLIAKIEYKAEQTTPAAQAAREQQDFAVMLKRLNGAIFRDPERVPGGIYEIRIANGYAINGLLYTDMAMLQELWRLNPNMSKSPFMETGRTLLQGFETYPYGQFYCNMPLRPGDTAQPGRLILSKDGRRINIRRPCPGKPDVVYLRHGG